MIAMMLAALLGAPPPDTLDSLLANGPVVSIEADAAGKFAAAIGLLDVAAPVDRVQYALDGGAHLAEGRQVSGDLSGSTWRWELFEASPGHTRVRYSSRARNFSSILDA